MAWNWHFFSCIVGDLNTIDTKALDFHLLQQKANKCQSKNQISNPSRLGPLWWNFHPSVMYSSASFFQIQILFQDLTCWCTFRPPPYLISLILTFILWTSKSLYFLSYSLNKEAPRYRKPNLTILKSIYVTLILFRDLVLYSTHLFY